MASDDFSPYLGAAPFYDPISTVPTPFGVSQELGNLAYNTAMQAGWGIPSIAVGGVPVSPANPTFAPAPAVAGVPAWGGHPADDLMGTVTGWGRYEETAHARGTPATFGPASGYNLGVQTPAYSWDNPPAELTGAPRPDLGPIATVTSVNGRPGGVSVGTINPTPTPATQQTAALPAAPIAPEVPAAAPAVAPFGGYPSIAAQQTGFGPIATPEQVALGQPGMQRSFTSLVEAVAPPAVETPSSMRGFAPQTAALSPAVAPAPAPAAAPAPASLSAANLGAVPSLTSTMGVPAPSYPDINPNFSQVAAVQQPGTFSTPPSMPSVAPAAPMPTTPTDVLGAALTAQNASTLQSQQAQQAMAIADAVRAGQAVTPTVAPPGTMAPSLQATPTPSVSTSPLGPVPTVAAPAAPPETVAPFPTVAAPMPPEKPEQAFPTIAPPAPAPAVAAAPSFTPSVPAPAPAAPPSLSTTITASAAPVATGAPQSLSPFGMGAPSLGMDPISSMISAASSAFGGPPTGFGGTPYGIGTNATFGGYATPGFDAYGNPIGVDPFGFSGGMFGGDPFGGGYGADAYGGGYGSEGGFGMGGFGGYSGSYGSDGYGMSSGNENPNS